ncbi:cbb3-type cytochrome c oxidase subunit I [Roseateles sp. BYS180W]|uniref:Cbb3-type cytochrome c oxidase subunit I n=1 Tax=Roseateles rivi TaxID=3299028 RepID=A0ABW7FRT3_9BURK
MTHIENPALDRPSVHPGVRLYLITSLVLLVVLMMAGVLMRAIQAGWLALDAPHFYQLMTLHGAGMVGIAGLAGAALVWHFLSQHVELDARFMWANLALFVAGVLTVVGSILIGGYGGGWTFLWPLPAKSMGLWSAHAAAAFVVGLLLIGVGFLLFNLDMGLAITRRCGSVLKGLGVDQLISGRIDPSHPTTVVAASMVVIVNTLGILSGAVVLVVTLVNLYVPEFEISALLAKNLIYFFGHVFINATIYMAVTAVYELLPLYTGRPWKVSRPFLAAWAAATLFVMAVYPHHLLLDSVMPSGLIVLGQVLSYLSGIPVLLVTGWGALTLVHRCGMRWKAPAAWLFLAMLGWSLGVVPAVVDGTLRVNQVMHNTLWVPGHFHLYLVGGVVPMVLGFAAHMFARPQGRASSLTLPVVYGLGTLGLGVSFLAAGWASVPRRWAEHAPAWQGFDAWGVLAGGLVVLAVLAWVVGLQRQRQTA